ncbi:MAG: DUF1761 domain-containing protein [bacterium]|nr:DUF1761 domain-containing protein [bacterium]
MITVTFWPILAAGVASVLIGWVWYHPRVFGRAWMRAANLSPEVVESGKKKMPLLAFVGLLASMLVAWIMNSLGQKIGIFDWVGAVFDLALWLWLGFVAPVLLGSVLWERKPLKYYGINAGYWLVSFIVMAVILVIGAQTIGGAMYDTGGNHNVYIGGE